MDEIKIEGLSDAERRHLAHWARVEGESYWDFRYHQEMTEHERRLHATRWRQIADTLHENPYSKEGGQ